MGASSEYGALFPTLLLISVCGVSRVVDNCLLGRSGFFVFGRILMISSIITRKENYFRNVSLRAFANSNKKLGKHTSKLLNI